MGPPVVGLRVFRVQDWADVALWDGMGCGMLWDGAGFAMWLLRMLGRCERETFQPPMGGSAALEASRFLESQLKGRRVCRVEKQYWGTNRLLVTERGSGFSS